MLNVKQLILYYAIKYDGDWNKIFNATQSKEDVDTNDCIATVSLVDQDSFITFLDENYPTAIKTKCYRPPFILFYKGDINLLKVKNALSLVGVRNPTSEAVDIAEKVLSDYDGLIVTGGSIGLEEVVYKTKCKPIVVLPNGLDKSEDLVNKVVAMGGLVITEYPNGVEKKQNTCVERCRIIEAIADKTFAIEVPSRSGAIIRCNFANEYGNDVIVCPKPSLEDGWENNNLINDGATILVSKEDLRRE